MINPDINNPVHFKALQAAIRLNFNNSDFKDYTAFLQHMLDILRRQGDTELGDQLKWNQGWRQCLQSQLDFINNAGELLKRSKEAMQAAEADRHPPKENNPYKMM